MYYKIEALSLGENVIIINKKIREVGNKYKEDNLPNNIFVDFSADTSDYINEMITSLQNAITNAIVCVMILLMYTWVTPKIWKILGRDI